MSFLQFFADAFLFTYRLELGFFSFFSPKKSSAVSLSLPCFLYATLGYDKYILAPLKFAHDGLFFSMCIIDSALLRYSGHKNDFATSSCHQHSSYFIRTSEKDTYKYPD